MKKITILLLVFMCFALTTCFSSYTGESSLTISLAGSGRAVAYYSDAVNFNHKITLTGPGNRTMESPWLEPSRGALYYTFSGLGNGTWTVTVEARFNELHSSVEADSFQPFTPDSQQGQNFLRAWGIAQTTLPALNSIVTVPMLPAIEVATFPQLQAAITATNNFGNEEIIVITAPFLFEHFRFDTNDIGASRNITLAARNDVTITRADTNGDSFFTVQRNVSLQLGRDGFNGTVTIDGNAPQTPAGSAIAVNADGMFILHDGIITNNTAQDGGGVYVDDNGIFTMWDGLISLNSAENGGGVYIAGGGIFTMNGGRIIGNTADSEGSGVYIENNGIFNRSPDWVIDDEVYP